MCLQTCPQEEQLPHRGHCGEVRDEGIVPERRPQQRRTDEGKLRLFRPRPERISAAAHAIAPTFAALSSLALYTSPDSEQLHTDARPTHPPL